MTARTRSPALPPAGTPARALIDAAAHLRDALLRDAGAVVRRETAHHGEAADAPAGRSASPETPGDAAGTTMEAAP